MGDKEEKDNPSSNPLSDDASSSVPSVQNEDSQRLPLLPLRDLIVFPHMMIPLFVGRDKSINALEHAMNNRVNIILAAQKDAKINKPEPDEIYQVGTRGSIIQLLRLPDGTVKVLIEGKSRTKIKEYVQTDEYFIVCSEEMEEEDEAPLETQALVRSVKSTFENYVRLNKGIPPEILMRLSTIDHAGELADIIAAQLNLKIEDKQKILEIFDPGRRLEKLLNMVVGEIEILEVEKKIRTRVRKQMERSQKEYYLNEQMQAIQKELGEKDDFQDEIVELEKLLSQKKMSKEASTKVRKEIRKLKMMTPTSAEAAVVRHYIDWILTLPWYEYSKSQNNLSNAQKVLEEDHYALEKVKERIVEHLAVQALTGECKGPILCFVGPPGVGKTSLGASIAKALARKFVRISLGGVRDEAEIRGHRRTYVGAMPGKMIQALKKAGTSNPLFLLDEIDKMSTDFRGDPSSALLEVLDPEQNTTFQDHYLEVEYDLSKIMFITTANSLHTIPRPLMDRMEIIHLEGYTETEKFYIARQYLIPKQMKAHGLKNLKMKIADPTLKLVIRDYTREAGVRNLERQIGTICRKLAREFLADKEKSMAVSETSDKNVQKPQQKEDAKNIESKKQIKSYIVTPKKMKEFLGPQKFKHTRAEEQNEIGLTNGMAWTEVGGDLLVVEVSIVPGKGNLTITGQLGDIMKESCSAAMSYVRSRGSLFGFEKDFYQDIDVHVHVPEGAIPKDGPSAGVAIVTSMVSAITKIPVRKVVAMTGEITLRGRVLPIGGLKEKVLAAHRGEITDVICPKENEKDLKDIPKEVMKELKIVLVDHVDQVLVNALFIKKPSTLFKSTSSSAVKGLKAQYTGHVLQ